MKFDKNLSAIHGYLCSDGYVSRNLSHQKHKYYSIGFRNTNFVLLKDFQDLFYQVFKLKPKLEKGQRCRLYSKELYFKLMEEGPYHSNNWRLPNISKLNMKYWLRAAFDCEGWIISDKRKTRSICFESVNRDQLPKMQKSLLLFGINSKIYKRKNRNTSILTIPDKLSIINFSKNIGFLHPEKKKKLQFAIDSFVNYYWELSEINFKKIMKEKAKVKKPYMIRLTSIKKENLIDLSNLLFKLYEISSKLSKYKNGLGNEYYCLSVNRKNDVIKIMNNNLLSNEAVAKIGKNL